LADEI
jgi:hypothetical protein